MSSNARIAGIDAARGCAMALVCLSHVKEQFVDSIPPLNAALTAVTRVATPTFLLLSGFVIAHLLESSRQRRIGLSLIDRGLFLLIVAHLLLNWNELLELGLTQWLFGRAVITDAIGISLCVAVLVRRASAGALLIGGASIALLSWPIALTLSVDSPAAALLGSVLFSLQSEENPAVDVALVPYLGLFLIGMGLSRRSADALAARDSRALARALIVPGLAAMAIVLAIAWLWHVFHHVAFDATDPYVVDLLRQTVDPRSKWPPSPA
jgi:uncharacterized membrane protein